MSPFRRVFLIVIVLGVVTATVSLGRWQLRRLNARKASNAVMLAARELPPMRLPQELGPGRSVDSGRRVVAQGHFDTSDQLILRGRAGDDGPGIQIVTPFVLDSGGSVLWVLRGFVRSPDAVTPPDSIPAPAPGPVTISGIAFALPVTSDSGHSLLHQGVTTWQRLDRGTVLRRRPQSLNAYLLLEGGRNGPGRLEAVQPTPLSNGPHLSYAIQWFGIGLAVLSFGILVVWRDGRVLSRPRVTP